MAQFAIFENNDAVVICYPEGDVMFFASKEAAKSRAEAISAVNNGVFYVDEIVSTKINGKVNGCHRAILQKDTDKIRGTKLCGLSAS